MVICSYNVNGIRAAFKKGFIDWLSEFKPDILCLQEIKAKEDQIDIEAIESLGYHFSAYPSLKPGYSGTAIISLKKPKNVVLGCGEELFDYEGRIIRADYDKFSVLSAYFPSGSSGEARQAVKMDFLAFFSKYIQELRVDRPNLIIVGDYNICREAIDIHDPVRNKKSSGFLPEEREWFGSFLELGFVDAFRFVHPEAKDKYSWWSYRANARQNNKGWRIDYTLLSESLRSKIVDAQIHAEVKHSDHCPISVSLK